MDMSEGIVRIEGKIERLDLRINGSLDKMANHVEASTYWRRFIMGTAISLAISMCSGAFALWTLTYNLGKYTQQIVINTEKLNSLEKVEMEAKSIRASNVARIDNLEEEYHNRIK